MILERPFALATAQTDSSPAGFCTRIFTGLLALGFGAIVAAAPIGYSVRSDGDDNLYRIDLATGEASVIGPSGFTKIEGMAMSPAGEVFAVDPQTASPRLLKCSTTPSSSAVCAATGTVALGVAAVASPVGLAFLPNGELYMAMSATIFSLNTTTGAATPRGPAGSVAIAGLAGRSPSANCSSGLFALGANVSPAQLYCVNTTSGALTALGPVTPSTLDAGFDADTVTGLLWEITNANPSQVFSINAETRATSTPVNVTLNGLAIGGFEGLAVAPSPTVVRGFGEPIPTLSTWWTLLAGLLLAMASAMHFSKLEAASARRLRK